MVVAQLLFDFSYPIVYRFLFILIFCRKVSQTKKNVFNLFKDENLAVWIKDPVRTAQ
jgi:hypothetical protein